MYVFTAEGHALGLRRTVLPVLIVGAGPDAFIGPCAWIVNLMATMLFRIVLACPSRDPEKCRIFADDYDLPDDMVSNDYAAKLRQGVDLYGDDLVVCICTETAYHCEHMLMAIEAGVKTILVDKPAVESYAQWKQVHEAAKRNEVQIYVSFQHTMNASVHQIAALVRDGVSKGVDTEIHTGFLQEWLFHPPQNRQTWRLDDRWCGLKDIGTHAADLGAVLAGSPVKTVTHSEHDMARESERQKPALDNGKMSVVYENGLTGTVRYHQAERGHHDDIYGFAEIGPDCYQFALEWGGGDTMYRKHGRSGRGAIQNWYPEVRGSRMFRPEVSLAWRKNPSGHMQAWDTMWFMFFLCAYRSILEKRGDERAKYMIPLAQNEAPTFDGAGRHATLFVEAAVKSFETKQAVDLEEVAV